MKIKRFLIAVLTVLAVVVIFSVSHSAAASGGKCAFQTQNLSFAGGPEEQARCLLSPVRKSANIGDTLDSLPDILQQLVGQTTDLSVDLFRKYLNAQAIGEDDVGGDLSAPLARTEGQHPAFYFVIHDTSTPNLKSHPFPDDLDSNESINKLAGYRHSTDAKAHIFVNRKGEVYLGHDFVVPWRATKLENLFVGVSSRGRFLHVELIQPRRSDPALSAGNDALAPKPGFSSVQYKRLAELYVAASLRAQKWLVPAYHAVLDSGFSGGHDDPQNFDLDVWDAALGNVISEVLSKKGHPADSIEKLHPHGDDGASCGGCKF